MRRTGSGLVPSYTQEQIDGFIEAIGRREPEQASYFAKLYNDYHWFGILFDDSSISIFGCDKLAYWIMRYGKDRGYYNTASSS